MKPKANKLGKVTSTDDLFRLKQSINQKTERSEQDVIRSVENRIAALFVVTLLTLLVSLAGL